MKKTRYMALGAAALSLAAASCNDDYLELYPKTTMTEQNAFRTYDNYRAFAYNLYSMFVDSRIYTNFSGNSYYQGGQWASDFYAGIMTTREDSRNPYAYGGITSTTSSSNWDFSYVRTANIMLSHLDDGVLTPAEKAHWRAVAYFFRAFWYMELVAKYGDVPWVNTVLNDASPEAYGSRTPRAEVADSIVANLEWAAANLGDTSRDGDNALSANAIKAALSRFLLREGTWAKYHGQGERRAFLEKCMSVSRELMNAYPTLHKGSGNNKYPGAGYDEVMTSKSLRGVAGVIMHKQYLDPLLRHRWSDLIHVEAHRADAPQATVDLFLMKNGRPIGNTGSGFKGGKGKDLWDYYEDRDPRLHVNFCPPAQANANKTFTNPDNVTTFLKWTFWKAGDTLNYNRNNPVKIITEEEAKKFRKYIDYFGPNIRCDNGDNEDESIGVKRLPGHNWGGAMSHSSPNITSYCQTDNYMRCWTGYYFWKHFTMWESGRNGNFQQSDKPIFGIEEVMLNYAEAAAELGSFTQTDADLTINKLRERVGVEKMTVGSIDGNWDPDRDKGDAAWIASYDARTKYAVDPVLWEIRRERMVELMGQGFSFYDVKRWHKAPYFTNRQPCGAWITATNVPYGTGSYTGSFVDYEEIKRTGSAAQSKEVGSGWIATWPGPLQQGTGWDDTFYLEMVPQDQINLNPNLTQNPGYNETFGIKSN